MADVFQNIGGMVGKPVGGIWRGIFEGLAPRYVEQKKAEMDALKAQQKYQEAITELQNTRAQSEAAVLPFIKQIKEAELASEQALQQQRLMSAQKDLFSIAGESQITPEMRARKFGAETEQTINLSKEAVLRGQKVGQEIQNEPLRQTREDLGTLIELYKTKAPGSQEAMDLGEQIRTHPATQKLLGVTGQYTGAQSSPYYQLGPEEKMAENKARIFQRLPPGEADVAAFPSVAQERARQGEETFRENIFGGIGGQGMQTAPEGMERSTTVDSTGRISFTDRPKAAPPAEEQKKLNDITGLIYMAQDTQNRLKPGYVGPVDTYLGRIRQFTGRTKTEETVFRANVMDMLSKMLYMQSGAAITPQEFERLRAVMPTLELPHNVFKDRLDRFIKVAQEIKATHEKNLAGYGYKTGTTEQQDLSNMSNEELLKITGK